MGGGSLLSAEKQSVYSTAPADSFIILFNPCTDLLNIFTKHKLEIFVVVCKSYGKWYISIIRSIVPLVYYSGIKI